ncbi:MAG: Lrp/AsnC family transcriptional regulator [Actinobacteria bacterium]|nr:Lrp/AsnC family transcriptional regulator [Actinomycetota bacterium]
MNSKVFNDHERKLVRLLQESIPLTPRPFVDIAAQAGMSPEEVISCVDRWKQEGTIRRFGAMVRHQRLGYTANAMSAWDVPEGRSEEVGRILAAAPEVSHCYERPRAEQWDFNVFAMIHGGSPEECEKVAAGLARRTGIDNYSLLYSSREFKKISMKYFIE